MTRPNQHDLDEDVEHLHDGTTRANLLRRAVRFVDGASTARLPSVYPPELPVPPGSPPTPEGHSVVAPGANGVLNAVSGVLGAGEGVATMRAAAAREHDARAHHDGRGAENAREDGVNGFFSTLRGGIGAAGGALQLAALRAGANVSRLTGLGTSLGHWGGVAQGAQGLFQLAQWGHNRNRPGFEDRASQELSDGILNTTSGALAQTKNPLALAASQGIALGTMARQSADGYARRTGVLGNTFTRQRGFHPGAGQGNGAINLSATDAATDVGSDVERRLGGGTNVHGLRGALAWTGGLLAAGGANVATVSGTLAHQGITAMAANVGGSRDDILARDQEERHAPLAANDHSAIAAHRRHIQHQHAQETAAREAAAQQHHAQIAAEGHTDMMAPEHAAANAPFTALNGANAQSIGRRALGMSGGFSQEDLERAVLENSR